MTDRTPSLRNRQKEMTRQLILDAYAALSLEAGFNNFTMQDIADRARISHRTLYRYYENREAILEGVSAEIQDRVYRPDSSTEGWVSALVHNYSVFGEYRQLMRVVTLLREANVIEAPDQEQREDFIKSMVEQTAPKASPLAKQQMFGLSRVVAGGLAWIRLTGPRVGLTDAEAGAASEWALNLILEAAKDIEGDLP